MFREYVFDWPIALRSIFYILVLVAVVYVLDYLWVDVFEFGSTKTRLHDMALGAVLVLPFSRSGHRWLTDFLRFSKS